LYSVDNKILKLHTRKFKVY